MEKTMDTEIRYCKNKKCHKELPLDSTDKYCSYCKQKRKEAQIKAVTIAATVLSLGIPILVKGIKNKNGDDEA